MIIGLFTIRCTQWAVLKVVQERSRVSATIRGGEVPWCHGLWLSWFVAVSAVAVIVCGLHCIGSFLYISYNSY